MDKIWAIAQLMCLAYAQNIAFTLVSRSRNRSSILYHVVASVFSNGVWFLTFRVLIVNNMDFMLFIPYTIATVSGSVTGQKVSMWIEKKIGATSDEHVKAGK